MRALVPTRRGVPTLTLITAATVAVFASCGHTIGYELTGGDRPRAAVPIPLTIGVELFRVAAKPPDNETVDKAGLTWQSNAEAGYGGDLATALTVQVVAHLRHIGVFARVNVTRTDRPVDLILSGTLETLEGYKQEEPGIAEGAILDPTRADIATEGVLASAFGLAGMVAGAPSVAEDGRDVDSIPVWVIARANLVDCELTAPGQDSPIWRGSAAGAIIRRGGTNGPNPFNYADLALKRALTDLVTNVHVAAIKHLRAR